ncbi:UNVERIFIED_CONTAM: Retrovirus-related Pol polyprotein from transposon TNT 1-94 [Sesamum radiatum]|uniref:Retrovirus-related Pol polyprotein from transposon TNT 1-94 n=1 Tax=Sesamum radiatum TaxID=300843 RepID=A0AAW2USJ2_SESRA
MLSLVKKLEDLKAGLENDTYIDVILQSLPPSYDPFIVNFNMNRLEKSINKLINMLVQYEATIKKLAPLVLIGEASTSKAKGKRAGCSKRKKGKAKAKTVVIAKDAKSAPVAPVGIGKGKKRMGTQQQSTANNIYAYCREKGHWKRDCPNLSSDQGVFVVEVLQRSRKLSKDEVVLRLGDGKAVAAEAVGIINLVVSDRVRLELKDCYFVPSMIKNIISILLLDNASFEFLIKKMLLFDERWFFSSARTKRLVDSKSLEIDNLDNLPAYVCGPLNTQARGGFSYFITFTDDQSRYGYVYLIRYKSKAFVRFKEFRLEVENQTGVTGQLDNDPKTYGEAMLDIDSGKWLEAMKSEMDSMSSNQACGKRIYPKKTFSPVAMAKSIRIMLAIAAWYDYEIWQMDVKMNFLNGFVEEEIYMNQSDGFTVVGEEQKVCHLQRSIYGLKQASRSWNIYFDEVIRGYDFVKNYFDPCVYKKVSGSSVLFLVLYVDDILLIGNDIQMLGDTKACISTQFSMKDLGEASYILGIKICRDRSKRILGMTQNSYVEKVLNRFKMEHFKQGFLPMRHGVKLSKKQSLRTDEELKRMLEIPYASTDDDDDDAKSNSEFVFKLNGGVVAWKSSKQDTTANSTMEAEYIAASESAKEEVWMKNYIQELGVVPGIAEPVVIFFDNNGAIAQAKEPRSHHRSKHILRRYHLLREMVGRGDVRMDRVSSAENKEIC